MSRTSGFSFSAATARRMANLVASERTVTGEVAEIRSSVISGNTWYYFRLKGKENACYYGISAADCPEAVTYNKDDQLTITYPISEDGTLRTASEIKVK